MRIGFGWHSSWPRIQGANTRLLLIGLCVWTDENGERVISRKTLASFSGACTATIDACILALRLADCLDVKQSPRDELGMFGTKTYALRLSNPRVWALFSFWRSAGNRHLASIRIPPDISYENQRAPPSRIGHPLSITSPGPYKDSRASSSFLLSLPDDYQIADPTLRAQVEKALSVAGRGADHTRVYDLVDSLVAGIPAAIARGFDFEDDVVACVQSATSYSRSDPLWSFKVVFERDLLRHRERRLRGDQT